MCVHYRLYLPSSSSCLHSPRPLSPRPLKLHPPIVRAPPITSTSSVLRLTRSLASQLYLKMEQLLYTLYLLEAKLKGSVIHTCSSHAHHMCITCLLHVFVFLHVHVHNVISSFSYSLPLFLPLSLSLSISLSLSPSLPPFFPLSPSLSPYRMVNYCQVIRYYQLMVKTSLDTLTVQFLIYSSLSRNNPTNRSNWLCHARPLLTRTRLTTASPILT